MNGVGDRCRAVLLLVQGKAPLDDDAVAQTRGYHCTCAVQMAGPDPSPSPEALVRCVKERVKALCTSSKLRVSFTERDYTMKEVAGDGNALGKLSSPLTVMDCESQDVGQVRAALLTATGNGVDDGASSYCLLVVLDLTHATCRPASMNSTAEAAQVEKGFEWLRPTQSYLSEYARETGKASRNAEEDERTVVALCPLQMYCALPMIRDTGRGEGLVDNSSTNVCMLEGILRELGYKAGQLPKYGA